MARSMKKKAKAKPKAKEKRSWTKKAKPPKWLPDGWTMEVGVDDNGVKFKYFLSPVSGCKFCSRKEVLHYLTLIKNGGHASEMTSTGDNGQIVVSQVKTSQEWLLPGWILEIRVRMSGGQAGQKYKCYYDPFSGSRFYSKADVFRFLESGKRHSATLKQKSSSNHTMDNVLAQIEYSPNGLPPGWTKEIMFRKPSSSGTGIKKDPYYTDPVHGYVFRSLKDASHYVATGELSKGATGRRRKSICGMCSLEGESPPPIPVTELNSLGATARQCLFTEEAAKSKAERTTEADDSSEKLRLPPADDASSESAEKAVPIYMSPDIELVKMKTKCKRTKIMTRSAQKNLESSMHVEKFKDKLLTLPTRASKRLAGCEPDPVAELVVCHPSRIEKGTSVKHIDGKTECNGGKEIGPTTENILQIPNIVKKSEGNLLTLPTRASKQLAACEPADVAELVFQHPSRVEKADSIYSSPDTEHRQRMKEHNRGKEIESAAENMLETSKHGHKRKHKFVTRPSRASKRLAGCEPDPVAELAIRRSSCKLISNGGNKEQFVMFNGGNKEQIDDTVQKIEEQVDIADPKIVSLSNDGYGGNKDQVPLAEHRSAESIDVQTSLVEQLVTEKRTDNRSPSLLAFPFLDAWGDPCIEFAVKTLIGEIPVLDEIPEFIQNQLSAVPTSNPTASAVVAFDQQSGEDQAKPPVQLEERHNEHIYIDGKTKLFPLENGLPSVGELAKSNVEGEPNYRRSPKVETLRDR